MENVLTEKRVLSSAKINLFLEITGKREDGYHEIETVMHEIDLADEISFKLREDGKINLSCDNSGIPCDENNLIIKAAMLLQSDYKCRLGADIHLNKKIPAGGGLGGGSSNCAATFVALNNLWKLKVPKSELDRLAAQLGSDINFFLYGGTCLCSGRGEKVMKLDNTCSFEFLLVFPEWGIPTKEAYKSLDKNEFGKKSVDDFLNIWKTGQKGLITQGVFNRFEKSVFNFEHREYEIFKELEKLGFVSVRMSGSGSTLYGILPENYVSTDMLAKVKKIKGVRDAVIARSKT